MFLCHTEIFTLCIKTDKLPGKLWQLKKKKKITVYFREVFFFFFFFLDGALKFISIPHLRIYSFDLIFFGVFFFFKILHLLIYIVDIRNIL